MLVIGGLGMKVVVVKSPKFIGFVLRKMFKVKKEDF